MSSLPDQKAWAVDALSLPWEDLDVYAFPPVSLPNQVVSNVVDQSCHRMIFECAGIAQHALVLGPSQPVGSDSACSTSTTRSSNTTLQGSTAPGSQESNLTYVAPRASTIQEQGFSDEVAELRLLRDHQPEQSTNQSGPFLSNGAGQTRWTSGSPQLPILQTFCCTFYRIESYNPALLKVIERPLLIW